MITVTASELIASVADEFKKKGSPSAFTHNSSVVMVLSLSICNSFTMCEHKKFEGKLDIIDQISLCPGNK